MKERIIYIVIVGLFVFLNSAVSFAQTAQKKYKYVPMSAPNRITVMLLDYPLHPQTTHPEKWVGYYVYRAEQGSTNFKRMTNEPVSAQKDALSMAQKMGSKAINRIMRNLKVKNYDAVFKRVLAGDSSLVIPAMFNLFVAEAFGLCWHDTKTEKGKTYLYYVTKVKADGTESLTAPPTNIEPVTAGVPQLPLTKINYIKAELVGTQIYVTYQKDDKGRIRNVYRSEDSLGTYTQINDLPLMSNSDPNEKYDVFPDSLVKPNSSYFYVVATEDVVGNALYSDTVSVKTKNFRTPPTPTILRTESTTEGLQLDWEIVDNASIVGYRLLRRDATANTPSLQDDKDNLYNEVSTVMIAPSDTTYIDATATSGMPYFYKIVSIDKYGTRSPTSIPFPARYFNKRAPVSPSNVRATPLMRAIKIVWSPNKEKDVSGYQVYRAYRDNENRELVSEYLSPLDTVFVDSSKTLSKKISFAYYIKALNQSENESPFSKPVFASPLEEKIKPQPMNSLSGTHNPFTGNELKWSEAYDIETAGVRIYRKMDATPDTSAWKVIYEESITRGKFTYLDTLIKPDEFYLYKMAAMSEDSLESDFSEILRLGATPSSIQAPQEVEIDVTERGLKVSWTPVIAGGLAKFAIYRRTNKESSKKIAEVSAGMYSYEDAIKEKGTYYYTIVPLHKSGKEGDASQEVSYQIKSF